VLTKSTTGRDPARESELLERDDELEAAARAAAQAAAGTGALLLVEGPAGIGKSRLLDAIAEVARSAGLRPLRASGGELERRLTFGVVRDLLGPLAGETDREGAAALGGAVVDGEPLGAPAAGDEAAALHGLRWLVEDASTSVGLALLVDDAQWADASSLRFLAYLARRVEALSVLLVIASRDGAPDGPDPAIEQLHRSAAARLHPAALSDKAAASLLSRAFGAAPAPTFVRACRVAAGGNPFLLHELATDLRVRGVRPDADQTTRVRSTGPRAVASAVATRVEAIGPEASALARAVAVLGQSADPALAAQLAGCPAGVAADAVIALAWADVLVDERPLRFTHPVVRAAVYGALGQTDRARLHRRAAELLLEGGRSADEVAAHLLATDPAGDPVVVGALREAGTRALSRGAPSATVDYLRRALQEPPRPDESSGLRALLGSAELRLGDPRAIGDLQQALAEAGDRGEGGQHALTLGRALMFAGRGREAVSVLGEAADAVADEDRELGLRLAAEAMFAARMNPATVDPARRRLDGWGELAGATPAERIALVAGAYSDALHLRRPAAEVAELAGRGLGGGALFAHEGPDSVTPYRASSTLALAERFDEAAEANARGLEDARARGSAVGFALASAAQADVDLRRGMLADAGAHARTALDLTAESGLLAAFLPFLLFPLLECLIERGELEAAEAVLARHRLTDELEEAAGNDLVLLARGRLRLAQGRTGEGIGDLLDVARRAEATGTTNPAAMPWRSAVAPTLARAGDPEKAQTLAAEELELARRWGTPRAIGVALRAAGDAEHGERSLPLLEEAVAVLEPAEGRVEHARALVSLGCALRREGRRQPAREPLARGGEIADRHGALALAEQAGEELRVAGARPRRTELSGEASLTASERRIVLLARDGSTNREIAESLWLSVKTVEMHLGHAYRKLGVSSRRELAEALDEHANGPPSGTVEGGPG
jgi:DNA-binding CsgD family transcriptional regulator